MANTFTIESSKYDERYIYVECTQTTDIESNTSKIDWTLTVKGGSDPYYSTGPTTLIIGGEQVYYCKRKSYKTHDFPTGKGSINGSIIVAHDADGSKSIAVSLTTAIHTQTTKTVEDTWKLDSIPRFATIMFVPATFSDEENPTITYTNPAGDAVTSLMACISLDGETDDIEYRDIDNSGVSYTFELDDSEREALMNATLNGNNMIPVYFLIKSQIGDTSSISKLSSNFYVANADPILNLTIDEGDEHVAALTGGGGTYIKGYSDLHVTVGVDTQKGASVQSCVVKLGDDVHNDANDVEYVKFENIQSNIIIARCQDNRGISVETEHKISLIDYFKPTINAIGNIEIYDETKARVHIDISGTFFNDFFGADDNSISVFIKHTGINDWSPFNDELTINGNSYSVEFNIDDLDYTKSFVYQVKVEDRLDSAITTSYTLRTVPVFDWGEDDFNFNVPIKLNNTPLFDVMLDLIYPVGSIYMSVNSINPATIFGGEWEQIKDRFLLAAGDTYTAGAVGGTEAATLTVDNLPSHSHEAASEYTGGSLLLRGPSDSNHNIADDALGGGNITKTPYDGTAWSNSISTSSTDAAPEQIDIGGSVSTTIESTGFGTPINIMPPYLSVFMWERTK